MTPAFPDALALAPWAGLSQAERQAVLGLQIDEAQLEFAGTIERAIDKLADGSVDAQGLAIFAAGRVVGYLSLLRQGRCPAWAPAEAAVVTAMRIDRRLQGQGLGSRALLAAQSWVHDHWPACRALALQVDAANIRGIKAYRRAGFEFVGQAEPGRIGPVRCMVKPIGPDGAAREPPALASCHPMPARAPGH